LTSFEKDVRVSACGYQSWVRNNNEW